MVGTVVWYNVGDTDELAKVIAARDSKTHATIRLLTGKQRGRELEAPWGIIESERKTHHSHSGYFIEVIVRPQEDCTFTFEAFIRTPDRFSGLPIENKLDPDGHHQTEEIARESGLACAKKKIGSWHAPQSPPNL